jgi:Zn-dependent peptidase ImmA (M78 family)
MVNNLVNKYKTRDVYELCDYLNIKIMYEDLGNIKGFYQSCLDSQIVHINIDLDDREKRIVAAHELGHVILHKELNILFLESNTYFVKNKYEKEANKFAIELLLKDDDLDKDSFKNMTLDHLSTYFEIPKELLIYKFNDCINEQ